MTEGLEIWTVYDHPKDFENVFVARKFVLDKPTDTYLVCKALAPLRDELMMRGLTCIPRADEDDPVIVECWI